MNEDELNEEQRQERARLIEHARRLQDVPDDELIGTAPGPNDDRYGMEMARRLKVAITDNTAEVRRFRESSDRLAIVVILLTVVLVAVAVVTLVKS
jgi:hypothetical protein